MSIKTDPTVYVSVENKTIFRVMAVIALVFLGVIVVSRILHPITLILISCFLALALNPAVSWLNIRLHIKSRVRATAIAYVLVLTILISFFSLVIPPLVRQTSDFAGNLPTLISDFRQKDTAAARFVDKYNLDDQLTQFGTDLSKKAKNSDGAFFSAAGKVGSVLVSLISVLVLTFMILIEGPGFIEKFWATRPESQREKYKKLASRMYSVVTGFVNGQLILATIAAGFALVALVIGNTVFDANINPLALAGIVGLFGLIPLIGNTLACIIVVLACLLTSAPLAITMLIYFVVYLQIENATLQPYIQSKKNELTPLIIFVVAICGASVAGLLGAVVAIPAAGCAKILIEEAYINRKSKNI